METERKIRILKGKAEALSITCNLANIYWNRVKMCFNIPLVLTSSVMCVLNSITLDANDVKLPNIIVNAISVLIISLNNSIKAGEKVDNFKKLSQGFLLLVTEMEDDDEKDLHLYNIKFNNLINDIEFSDITSSIKKQVNMLFDDDELPLQIKTIEMKKKQRSQPSSATPSVDIGMVNF